MPNRRRSVANPTHRELPSVSFDQLERQREALSKRLERIGLLAKKCDACRTARTLLGRKYLQANLAARVAVLRAAEFIICLLEMAPPL